MFINHWQNILFPCYLQYLGMLTKIEKKNLTVGDLEKNEGNNMYWLLVDIFDKILQDNNELLKELASL